ncbi:FAD-dependent monooxygenase [Candidatus Poriferisocius sp.]|uniref:FAD binding domain-containing protein n=1 Tax=Candidatus Poriferisocius sp. TaxID=3101276 RepID=UPI003B5985ED
MKESGVKPLQIAVVGGSIGGLTAAILLHEVGHDVHVFERSASALEDRGAGIVVLPMTERYFAEKGSALGEDSAGNSDLALTLTYWTYVDRFGSAIDAAATYNRFTSWNTLYRALLEEFPSERYHLAHNVKDCAQFVGGVTIAFEHGESRNCDLLVAADGIASTVRGIVSPHTTTDYAGYVAWRGTVLERNLEPATAAIFEDAMIYQVLDHAHILAYAIPGLGDSTVPGQRALNFVWYRNAAGSAFEELMVDRHDVHRPATVPPGLVQDRFVSKFRQDAEQLLAPPLRDLVLACEKPFIQAIFDMAADRFVHGRIVLIGDAATALRPHVAAGTAKACADGWALCDHLGDGDDLDASLANWERQQLSLARTVAARSRRMGQRAQFDSKMVAGDPDWRFGLFEPGN